MADRNRPLFLQIPLHCQRGQALLVLLMVLVVAGSAVFYSFAGSANSAIERDKITAAALAQAKEALIGYAAADANRPGSLPCPDLITNLPNNTPNDGVADLYAGSECPGFVTSSNVYLGRLPWRTLGLPDLRDGNGERLWYAVSRDFARNPTCSPNCPLNSDTLGQLTVTGISPASNVVAIIFSPGMSLSNQVRDSAGENTASNYLEDENANGNNPTFTAQASSTTFKDRLLPITKDALMAVVEMRVLRTMRAALIAYRATPGNSYPFANPYSDNINYECAYLQTEGRFPVKIKTLLPLPSGCSVYADWGPELPAWFGNNLWQTVSYYSVDPCKVGSVATAGGTTVSDLNALCALGLPPRVDGAAKDAVILIGGSALAAVPGQTPRPCVARSACLEAPNLSGNAFVTPTRSSTNNDRLASVP